MAYNPNFASYGNPYGMGYGVTYPQQMMPAQQPSYIQQPQKGIDWVDGEAAARAYQLPPGVTQYAMWDINEPVIYIKSINQAGMPNPLQKVWYRTEERQEQKRLDSGSQQSETDMTGYVRKEDLETLREEMKEVIRSTLQGAEMKGARTNAKSAT